MDFWEEVKRDVQKGLKEGVTMMKAGASIAAKKVNELTREGRKQLRAFDLKSRVHGEMAELGARIYELSREGGIALKDSKTLKLIERIQKLEARIASMKEDEKPVAKKTSAAAKKKKTAGRPFAGKKTVKKAAASSDRKKARGSTAKAKVKASARKPAGS